jgi:hypothetical protein
VRHATATGREADAEGHGDAAPGDLRHHSGRERTQHPPGQTGEQAQRLQQHRDPEPATDEQGEGRDAGHEQLGRARRSGCRHDLPQIAHPTRQGDQGTGRQSKGDDEAERADDTDTDSNTRVAQRVFDTSALSGKGAI